MSARIKLIITFRPTFRFGVQMKSLERHDKMIVDENDPVFFNQRDCTPPLSENRVD